MLDFDELTAKLYQEDINWIYSIIKDLDKNSDFVVNRPLILKM